VDPDPDRGVPPMPDVGVDPDPDIGVPPIPDIGVPPDLDSGVDPDMDMDEGLLDMEMGVDPHEDMGVDPHEEMGVDPHEDMGVPPDVDMDWDPDIPGGTTPPGMNCTPGTFRCAPWRNPQAMDRCDPSGWVAVPSSQDCSQFSGNRCYDNMGVGAHCR